ncbi:MAG TPA: peptidase C39 family protein [Pararhizobium sp.]|nr:peptidase C39 family protein [Pararhizobium sp.]
MSALRIRAASLDDIDALSAIEAVAFATDRISRRSFRALIVRPTAATLVAEMDGSVAGYAMILFRAGTGMARLYSLAVAPERTGAGLGRKLLEAAEEAAKRHDRIMLRLEVREDNEGAIALYRKCGYRQIGRIADYYDDGMAALRFEKLLRADEARPSTPIPFYEQTTDFTCGSACLLMALARFVSPSYLDPVWEIRLWREATTIFMLAGPGGCEPFGLAVVSHSYGLKPSIYCSQTDEVLFLNTVRNPEKRKVMKLAQMDFRHRAHDLGIEARLSAFTLHDVRAAIAGGKLVVVLVSGYLMFGKKVPHWVLAHGDDGRHIMIHDPWVEEERGETVADAANLPVPYAVFDRISRFGRNSLRAAVFLEGQRADV